MNSRNHTGNIKSITTGTARAIEPSRLMAPRPVKFLAEHSIAGAAMSIPAGATAVSPPSQHRRMHSLGYGIDE